MANGGAHVGSGMGLLTRLNGIECGSHGTVSDRVEVEIKAKAVRFVNRVEDLLIR